MNYYPKGGRCKACTKVNEDCSRLPFDTMPVHRRDGADAVVICTEYQQINRNESMKADCIRCNPVTKPAKTKESKK